MSLARTQPAVLFVEDDEGLRITFSALLRKFGFEVETADSFAAAQSFLEHNQISGMITDDELGDGRGVELAELALRHYPDARIGIVSGERPEIPKSIADRVVILQKPFTMEDLRRFLDGFPRTMNPA